MEWGLSVELYIVSVYFEECCVRERLSLQVVPAPPPRSRAHVNIFSSSSFSQNHANKTPARAATAAGFSPQNRESPDREEDDGPLRSDSSLGCNNLTMNVGV